MKTFDYPENTLLPWAAKLLGRPIKWTSDRAEAFLTDTQGREQKVHAELALDKDGRFLAVRAGRLANIGAYLSHFSVFVATMAGFRLLTGAYRIPAAHVHVRLRLHQHGLGRCLSRRRAARMLLHHRAAGRCGGARDRAWPRRDTAAQFRIPPRRCLTRRRSSPPTTAATSPPISRSASQRADFASFEARRNEARKRGKLRGLGISYYMEVTAAMPQEKAAIAFLSRPVASASASAPAPRVRATRRLSRRSSPTGSASISMAIDFVTGDTDALTRGGGTGGAKSLLMAGTAVVDGAERIIAKGKKLAGHVLEAAESDIEFSDGRFRIAGTDRSIGILELAARARQGTRLPEGLPSSLDDAGLSTGNKNTFPNGCHLCEIEIDEETGTAQILRYVVADDFGVLVNPLIVEGQIHGGIAQGAGQMLIENASYDAGGQLLTGSFLDYAMPRAADFPGFEVEFHNVPCATNVLGIKGAGEAGTVGALGATMNAVMDALAPLGVTQLDLPATPQRLWAAIRGAGRRGYSSALHLSELAK